MATIMLALSMWLAPGYTMATSTCEPGSNVVSHGCWAEGDLAIDEVPYGATWVRCVGHKVGKRGGTLHVWAVCE